MSRITDAFRGGKAFIPFITAGDPDTDTTAKVIRAAAENGADIIEIGIPFSDPTAEGPVIQGANLRALSGGMTTDRAFELVRELRRDVNTPFVFMTYANVVFSYGTDRFMERCAETGVDGIILPDVPFEEREEFAIAAERQGIDLIPLIAPTSDDRIAMIAREAKGFVYIVSSLGVTGVRSEITTDIGAIVETIRRNTDIPCAVGFGISEPFQAAKMAALSDGAIVGSAIIRMIEKYGKDSPAYVGEYVKTMKQAVDAGRK
ncbi:MAG: tryptophan synthase subunit alpha [Oscillospiraceae bacterium]|nr:tryptophan synthase subunit alpha [Oscillospiraceae bacterium]